MSSERECPGQLEGGGMYIVYVQDIEWGASDGDGYSLDLEVLVGGVGGESSEADGVVDEEGETAPCVSKAVFPDEVVAVEGWDGRVWV